MPLSFDVHGEDQLTLLPNSDPTKGNVVTFLMSWVLLSALLSVAFVVFRTKAIESAKREEDYSMLQAAPLATCWILIGAALVFLNKYIFMLENEGGCGFPYPASLCSAQMCVCMVLTRVLSIAKPQLLPSVATGAMTWGIYARSVVPVGLTLVFSVVLSNAAYLYLSVSYIQMLNATGPMSVYLITCAAGIDVMRPQVFMVLGAVALGVATTSMGESLFSMFGVLLYIGAFICDGVKLVLQRLMVSSSTTCKLDPLAALYYFSPVCFFGIAMVAAFVEPLGVVLPQARKLLVVLIIDVLVAFALQVVSVFLLQCASATTYSLCSVVRDVGLVCIASIALSTPLATVQTVGYASAVCGVLIFNALIEDRHCINRAFGYCSQQEAKLLSTA